MPPSTCAIVNKCSLRSLQCDGVPTRGSCQRNCLSEANWMFHPRIYGIGITLRICFKWQAPIVAHHIRIMAAPQVHGFLLVGEIIQSVTELKQPNLIDTSFFKINHVRTDPHLGLLVARRDGRCPKRMSVTPVAAFGVGQREPPAVLLR